MQKWGKAGVWNPRSAAWVQRLAAIVAEPRKAPNSRKRSHGSAGASPCRVCVSASPPDGFLGMARQPRRARGSYQMSHCEVLRTAAGAVAGRQASTQPPLATSATSNRAAVGSGIGAVRKPRPAWVVCGGCRLKAAFPDRVRRPRRAWLSAHGRQVAERAGLASAGRSADAPACGQAVGSRLARTNLDLGRGRWIRGGSERMNGQAKDLSDRNTCIIYDSAARRSGLEENLRLSSLNGKKMFEGAGWEPDSAGETPTGATETVALPLSLARSVFQKSTKAPRGGTLQETRRFWPH